MLFSSAVTAVRKSEEPQSVLSSMAQAYQVIPPVGGSLHSRPQWCTGLLPIDLRTTIYHESLPIVYTRLDYLASTTCALFSSFDNVALPGLQLGEVHAIGTLISSCQGTHKSIQVLPITVSLSKEAPRAPLQRIKQQRNTKSFLRAMLC